MVYQWKSQARLSIDPQKTGEVLEDIEKQFGRITPELVLEEAKIKTSPIHKGFEWEDSIAAEQYRLDQARYILRQIVIVRETSDTVESNTIRAFMSVNITDSEENKYTTYATIGSILNNNTLRKQLLLKAFTELQQWNKRYKDLTEFAILHETINNTDIQNL